MKKIYSLYLIIATAFLLNSCNEDAYARIEIETPIDNQNFDAGNIIQVKATIYDDGDAIMNEELVITSMQDNTVVKEIKDSKFCFTYYFDESFVGETNTKYKIEFKSRGGHGNWHSKVIYVKSN